MYYNPSQSSTYSTSILTRDKLRYGSATLTGYMGQDYTCLSRSDTNTCLNNFNFFVITEQTGLTGLDGILGLSPSSNSESGPSYMQGLIDAGSISEGIASFWITGLSTQSVITLGGVDPSSYTGSFTTHDVVASQDAWWTVNLSGLKYGGTSIKSGSTRYAIVDTGTSLLTLSKTDYDNFVD